MKQIQENIFNAIKEAHQTIGRFSAHQTKSTAIEQKGEELGKIALKYGINPEGLKNIYFGKK